MNFETMADAWRILMLLFLSHECFAQFALDPDGVVRVCTGQNQQFMCTSVGVTWNISGFGNGISDTELALAVDYARNNIRVTTTDDSTISNPSTLTFMMLGYPDDNASVTCIDNPRSSMITSTIRIGPPNCTVDFSVMASGVTIIVNLTVYACVGYLPMYEVVLSTNDTNEPSTMSIETPPFMASTILQISDQKPLAEYNVSLKLVDPYCQNSTVATRHVVTEMRPVPPTPPGTLEGTAENVPAIVGGTVGGLIVVVLIVIIVVVAVVIIKQKNVKKAGGERLTAQHGEEMVDVHGDTTYAAPGKDKAAVEGGDGVYSYAATTTVVGAQHNKPGGETKVSVQPEKPKRSSKKQPPPADVPHKQGPVGDLYAMPDKKAPEVGHKAGPQGDMYAMAAKPSKGGYGAEGP